MTTFDDDFNEGIVHLVIGNNLEDKWVQHSAAQHCESQWSSGI